MISWLKNLVSNSGNVSKALVAIVGAVTVALTTHSWTDVPSIVSYVAAALVYLIPNTTKTSSST
jgi:putative Ca2+/H+ antiporter (TMEM165/GDT1 family)